MLTIICSILRIFFIFSLFFLHLCSIKADIGAPEHLAGDFLGKNYELGLDGIESTVLKIEGIGNFNSITTKSEKPVIIRCFLGSGQAGNQLRFFFQDVARDLNEKAFSYSIDFGNSPDVMEQLVVLFSKVSLGNKALALHNPALYSFLISLTHQLVHAFRGEGDVKPFFLFFKNGTLVVPGDIRYATKKELQAAINEQLMRLETVVPARSIQIQRSGVKTGQRQQRVPLWQKVKGWFSKK